MDIQDQEPDDQLAMLKQLDRFSMALAQRTAKYHTELIDRGLPAELAAQLARDWHGRQIADLGDLYRRFVT